MLNVEKENQIGFILLYLFCAIRPLSLIEINLGIPGPNITEIFAVIVSYLLLLFILLNVKRLKIDITTISILLFCSYCLISIFWGSELRTISQVTLPFILFFSIRIAITKPIQIKLLLSVAIVAYGFPIFGSLYQIIQGISVGMVESITGIERHVGMFKSIKPFSYAMFFFSVLFYMQFNINQIRKKQMKLALMVLLIASFYCVFKTYARTAYIGLFIFWAISLWGYKKKYLIIFLISALIIGTIYSATVGRIFFKKQDFDANTASSGRVFLWEHNINLFFKSSFDRKILGHGLGVGSTSVIGAEDEIWSSHNDFLHLLLQLGSVGLILYLLIHFVLLKDIYFSKIGKKIKYFFIALVLSVAFMNFASGIIVYQVGMSQQYWMVMGFLYVFKDNVINLRSSITS